MARKNYSDSEDSDDGKKRRSMAKAKKGRLAKGGGGGRLAKGKGGRHAKGKGGRLAKGKGGRHAKGKGGRHAKGKGGRLAKSKKSGSRAKPKKAGHSNKGKKSSKDKKGGKKVEQASCQKEETEAEEEMSEKEEESLLDKIGGAIGSLLDSEDKDDTHKDDTDTHKDAHRHDEDSQTNDEDSQKGEHSHSSDEGVLESVGNMVTDFLGISGGEANKDENEAGPSKVSDLKSLETRIMKTIRVRGEKGISLGGLKKKLTKGNENPKMEGQIKKVLKTLVRKKQVVTHKGRYTLPEDGAHSSKDKK